MPESIEFLFFYTFQANGDDMHLSNNHDKILHVELINTWNERYSVERLRWKKLNQSVSTYQTYQINTHCPVPLQNMLTDAPGILWRGRFTRPYLCLHPLKCLLAESPLYLFPDLLLAAALVIVITLFSGILWKLMKNECNKEKSCFYEN